MRGLTTRPPPAVAGMRAFAADLRFTSKSPSRSPGLIAAPVGRPRTSCAPPRPTPLAAGETRHGRARVARLAAVPESITSSGRYRLACSRVGTNTSARSAEHGDITSSSHAAASGALLPLVITGAATGHMYRTIPPPRPPACRRPVTALMS